jgi:hypothetical protein
MQMRSEYIPSTSKVLRLSPSLIPMPLLTLVHWPVLPDTLLPPGDTAAASAVQPFR